LLIRASFWVGLWAVGMASVSAQVPERFFVTAANVGDTFPFFADFILDVSRDASDVLVRYIRIAPLGESCPRTITVKAVETRLKNTSPAKIAGKNNPCDVPPESFREAILKYPKAGLIFASVGFGVVAQCGGREVALKFPYRARIDLEQLKQGAPQIAQLLNLWDDVKATAFGASEPFKSGSIDLDLGLQQAGAAIVPELLAGRFDAGFSEGAIAKVLADYHGPVLPPDFTAELVNASDYPFASYAPPVYPPVAKVTRSFGSVLLELKIDQSSGEVRQAVGLSGDPLLSSAALEAARKWRFVPGAISAQPIRVMLDFAWRCP